jgi:hypothetical protein
MAKAARYMKKILFIRFEGFNTPRLASPAKQVLGLLIFLFVPAAFGVFAQTGVLPGLSTLGIFPFEAADGATEAEAASLAAQVAAELRSWGTFNVLEGEDAGKAEYTVKGRVVRQDNRLVLSAVSYNSRQNVLNSPREQAAGLSELAPRIFPFCVQLVENVPFPNYFPGTWQAVIDIEDGPLVCIIEFQTGGRVLVKQFDTYERRGSQSLRYQAIGAGTYSSRGLVRKDDRGVSVGAALNLTASLEDALPKYSSLNASRLSLIFEEGKNVFELGGAGFPCGDRPGEPGLAYTRFTKIP